MRVFGYQGGFYKLTEWIYRLAIVNILWIALTLAGLVVIGFFPATTAMFAVVRKWTMKEDNVPIFKTFWNAYKQEFIKSNGLGYLLTLIAAVLFIDFLFLQSTANETIQLLYIPFMMVKLIFISMVCYVFPIFVHYDMKVTQVIKNSFFLMIMNPLSTIIMVVGSFGLAFLLNCAPPLCLLFSGNLFALMLTKPANKAFNKIHRKSQLVAQE